jgi:hypothetical protein
VDEGEVVEELQGGGPREGFFPIAADGLAAQESEDGAQVLPAEGGGLGRAQVIAHHLVEGALPALEQGAELLLQGVAGLIPSFGAVISIDIETAQPIAAGQEFVAEIHIDNSPRLSAYEFRLVFDGADMSFVRMEDLGAFFSVGKFKMQIGTRQHLNFG